MTVDELLGGVKVFSGEVDAVIEKYSDIPVSVTVFQRKVDYGELKKTSTDLEEKLTMKLSEIVKKQAQQLIGYIEKSGILNNKNLDELNKLQLKYVGDFKKVLENILVKMYLDSKISVLKELIRGGLDIELKTKFAEVSVESWQELPPEEAIDLFNKKVIAKITTKVGEKVLLDLATNEEMQYWTQKAFAIAGIERDNILKDAKMSILNSLKLGKSIQESMYDLEDIFDNYIQRGDIAPHRLETIVRTNISEAMNMGRKQIIENDIIADEVGYVEYSAVMDERTRPTHAEMHGKVFRADDPIVDEIWPPNGYNCRCIMVPVTDYEIEREGLIISTEADIPPNFPDKEFR